MSTPEGPSPRCFLEGDALEIAAARGALVAHRRQAQTQEARGDIARGDFMAHAARVAAQQQVVGKEAHIGVDTLGREARVERHIRFGDGGGGVGSRCFCGSLGAGAHGIDPIIVMRESRGGKQGQRGQRQREKRRMVMSGAPLGGFTALFYHCANELLYYAGSARGQEGEGCVFGVEARGGALHTPKEKGSRR
jgi:hypothetical protein